MNCGSRSDKQQKIFRILLEVAPWAPVYCILLVVMLIAWVSYSGNKHDGRVGRENIRLLFCLTSW